MTQKIVIEHTEKKDPFRYCKELEKGNILFFPSIPFPFLQDDLQFLVNQKSVQKHPQIIYQPHIDQMTRLKPHDPNEAVRFINVLRNFFSHSTAFLSQLLEPYSKRWTLDFASFWPYNKKGWTMRRQTKNEPLHIDTFTNRSICGKRILRFFMNIHPTESRRWITSKLFEELAKEYGGTAVSYPKSTGYSFMARIGRKIQKALCSAGLKTTLRSPYDGFMLRFHNFLKKQEEFQKTCSKDFWTFPPNSCWAFFTDQVSHAALSDSYTLEQTFLVPSKALLFPERSPIHVMERLSGRTISDFE